LAIPTLVALGAFWSAVRLGPVTLNTFVVYGVLGFLFYSAPHLLWAGVAALSKASPAVWHAGLLAANLALVAVALVSFTGAHDPSGLPLQWVAYFPGAVVLQALFAGTVVAVNSGWRVGA
jgi:hypothetical protein